jgi:uncharacterized membrane protein YbhN (UPF0104 family)
MNDAIANSSNEIVKAMGVQIVGRVGFTVALGGVVFLKLMIIAVTLGLLLAASFWEGQVLAMTLAFAGLGLLGVAFFAICRLPDSFLGIDTRLLKHCFSYAGVREMRRTAAGSLLMQAGEILVSFVILMSLGASAPFMPFLYATTVMMVAGMLPISVQGIGVRETAAIATIGSFISPETGFAFGVLLTVIHHIIPAAVGALVWLGHSGYRVLAYPQVLGVAER